MRRGHRSSACRAGFTLIEVMVVVLILGILAALIVPNVVGRAHDARVAAAKQDIATLAQALAMYKLDNGRLPTSEQGLKALVEKPTVAPIPPNWRSGGYIARLPNDPWGAPYQYASPGLRGEFDVWSFGADGKPGGEGEAADIGTWNL
ncbi:MAG: type II secretion system major pseudopilin GspG [Casimicrobiaceae bacterium]|nr:type II secretion system major pseudopilin GspG [Casimicrobiaceae bacterium]MCX8099125.1 type II secretion system major pseudopilin GspG [Casimicrobiaceae bacterium]MDW8312192.1 type II secretion system major pseudopilin GspG [Burkholderiales bacterium]